MRPGVAFAAPASVTCLTLPQVVSIEILKSCLKEAAKTGKLWIGLTNFSPHSIIDKK